MNNWENYSPREGLTLQEVDGELVILDQSNEKIHQLNPAATAVWRTIDATASVSPAVALKALLDNFDVDKDAASADVDTLLTQFVELKLLVNAETSEPSTD